MASLASDQWPEASPAEKVELLLETAKKVTDLDTTLSALFSKHKFVFLDVFSRQIDRIRSRSQYLEDAQITIYDKVLLALTHNGIDLEDPPALTWYASNYLGFNEGGGKSRNVQLVEQALFLPTAVSQAHASLQRAIAISPPETSSPSKSQNPDPSVKGDSVFVHLWTVYERALADYYAVADDNNLRTTEAARFLRDTAENGIHYLSQQHKPDDQLLADLTETYNMATRAVENLSGGRKRKFDHAADKQRRRRPNRQTALRSPRTTNESGRSHERQYSRNPRNSGRGHSNIPYGYSSTRRVDSYIPSHRYDTDRE